MSARSATIEKQTHFPFSRQANQPRTCKPHDALSAATLFRSFLPRSSFRYGPAYDRELGGVLERAILGLPEDHRLTFMLRDVEGMSTDETAECLNISPENVKVRLHRARAGLRKELFARAGATTVESFQFHASRCDRIVQNVFRMLGLPE